MQRVGGDGVGQRADGLVGGAAVQGEIVRHRTIVDAGAAKQFGLGYVQYMIMEDQKLVEKYAQLEKA